MIVLYQSKTNNLRSQKPTKYLFLLFIERKPEREREREREGEREKDTENVSKEQQLQRLKKRFHIKMMEVILILSKINYSRYSLMFLVNIKRLTIEI